MTTAIPQLPAVLFPFADYWPFYVIFSVGILILLFIDLTAHKEDHVAGPKEAGIWIVVWVALAVAFSGALYLYTASKFGHAVARQVNLEFLAGYLMEESLSVDNMFVFALVFRYFAIEGRYQHRVLFYGVLGAMVFRGIFIALGSVLIQFHWIVVGFGLFLIFTGIRMAKDDEKQIDPGANPVIRLARRWLPVTGRLHEHRFLVKIDGVRHLTPLAIVLIVLETTDILFAVDSVPAVFGVTKEPLIVYTSNVFAILGLRSLYFLLAGAMDRFHILKYGLAFVLVFVGIKMAFLDHYFGGRFPIGVSLGVICVAIAVSIVLSLVIKPKTE